MDKDKYVDGSQTRTIVVTMSSRCWKLVDEVFKDEDCWRCAILEYAINESEDSEMRKQHIAYDNKIKFYMKNVMSILIVLLACLAVILLLKQ